MRTIAILGVGLIGGSFGLAVRKAGFEGEVLGVSSALAIEAALERGAITRGASLEEAAAVADLIYLAQPVDVILHTLERLGPITRVECLITDVGSTKRLIVQKAQDSISGSCFLGGHPLAGKELRGVGEADADLFRGRPYVLTRCAVSAPHKLEPTFREWLDRIGACTIEMDAAEHDRAVAFTSHLPQLLSTALATTLQELAPRDSMQVFGNGLLDMTRLALSAPDLWLSILATNKTEVSSAIKAFIKVLTKIQRQLGTDELRSAFENANQFASGIRK